MHDKLLESHALWRDKFLSPLIPRSNWVKTPVWVRHGSHGFGPPYTAKLIHPASWHLDDAEYRKDGIIEKGFDTASAPETRWITIHPFDPDHDGHAVLTLSEHDGQHRITGGHPGYLGLYLSHILSDDMYAALAKHRHHQHHEDEALENMLNEFMSPKRMSEKEKDNPKARNQVVLKPTINQAISLAKIAVAGSDNPHIFNDLKNEIIHATGAKKKWLEDHIEKNPDELHIVLVANDKTRQKLSGNIKNSMVYFSNRVDDEPEEEHHLINWDFPQHSVGYKPNKRKSHTDLLLDEPEELKRLDNRV